MALAALLLPAAGCRHADLARDQLALRGQRAARTVTLIAEHERSGPRRLARTLSALQTSTYRSVQASRANVGEVGRYWRRDWQRWSEGQPAYRNRVKQILGGKPERIEPNAIKLFF